MQILRCFVFFGVIVLTSTTGLTVSPPVPQGSTQLATISKYIEEHESEFIEELRKAVAIPNVSSWVNQRSTYPKLWDMIRFVQDKLHNLGFHVRLQPLGISVKMEDGFEEPMPPVIFATLGSSPVKETLLIYGHLDVVPAKQRDGWDSDPFILTPRDGALHGRGTTDDKGPVLGWIHAIQGFVRSGIDLPINIKLVLESGEETGSAGLEDVLQKEENDFLANISMVAISDNYWVGMEIPSLTYGLRGYLPFEIVVEGGTKEFHSGQDGGAIYEPMNDLIWILGQMQDSRGRILIPGGMEDVDPLKPGERESYRKLDFDLNSYKDQAGNPFLLYPNSRVDTLLARWRYPSLSIHGVQGGFSDPGFKAIIPNRVSGKFSLRTVLSQNLTKIGEAVEKFLEQKWKERGSPNGMRIIPHQPARPWEGETDNKNYRAAAAAIKHVYGREPQFTRQGGSGPMTIVLEELTKSNVLHIPMGQSDDGAHAANEKISKRNYIQGTKVFAAYFMELGNRRGESS